MSAQEPLLGRVDSLESRQAVEGAVVTLAVSGLTTSTNEFGQFAFGFDPQDSDTLVVSHPDFVTARVPLGDMPGQGWSIVVRIKPRPVSLDPPTNVPNE